MESTITPSMSKITASTLLNFLIILFSVTLLRVSLARLKIDQIVYTYWVPLTLLGLVGLICLMWDQTIMTQFGIPSMIELLGLA
jgi:NADH:ubiquinone oxidoreductase subunit H